MARPRVELRHTHRTQDSNFARPVSDLYLCGAHESTFPTMAVSSRMYALGAAGLAVLWAASAPAVAVPAIADASGGSQSPSLHRLGGSPPLRPPTRWSQSVW